MPSQVRVRDVIRSVTELPTLPHVYAKICDVIDSPDVSPRRIEGIIENDPPLTGKLLRLVNSAFFSFSDEISTVRRAVAILGFQTLKQLVLTTSVMQVFGDIEDVGIDPVDVWKHSLATAAGARALGEQSRHAHSSELFVAGLLHDVGILYEMKYHPEEFSEVVRLVREEGQDLLDAETAVLGQGHDVSGAILLRHWRLPVRIVNAVSDHHRPQSSALPEDAAALSLSEALASILGFGNVGEERLSPLAASTWGRFDLRSSTLDSIADAIESSMKGAETLLNGARTPMH